MTNKGSTEGSRKEVIKRMAGLLRSGAVMLDQTCPICGSPLFRLKNGEIVCPQHGPIRIVGTEEEAVEATTEAILSELEKTISFRIHQIIQGVNSGSITLSDTLLELDRLLGILERIKRVKRNQVSESQK